MYYDPETLFKKWQHFEPPTSIAVVQICKLVPLVVLDEAQERPLDVRPHLDDELLNPIQREAGSDEGNMERPAKRRDSVDGLLIVESENGVDSSGELWTDWNRRAEWCYTGGWTHTHTHREHTQPYVIGECFKPKSLLLLVHISATLGC